MDYKTAVIRLRGFNFVLGVLDALCKDPFCAECRGLTKTHAGLAGSLKEFESDVSSLQGGLPAEFTKLQVEVYKKLSGLNIPANSESQKALGRCALTDVCLPKAAMAVLVNMAE